MLSMALDMRVGRGCCSGCSCCSGSSSCTDATQTFDDAPDGPYELTVLDTGETWLLQDISTGPDITHVGPDGFVVFTGLAGVAFCAGCSGLRMSWLGGCEAATLVGVGNSAPQIFGPPGDPGFLFNVTCDALSGDFYGWDGAPLGSIPGVLPDVNPHTIELVWAGTEVTVIVDSVTIGTVDIGAAPTADLVAWFGGLGPSSFGDIAVGCEP